MCMTARRARGDGDQRLVGTRQLNATCLPPLPPSRPPVYPTRIPAPLPFPPAFTVHAVCASARHPGLSVDEAAPAPARPPGRC